MPGTDALQQTLLLFGWFLAIGFDVGGLIRHLWRLRQRQRVYEAQTAPDLQFEARLRRNNEVFRAQLKLGMIVWAAAVLIQRLAQDGAAPIGWWAWLIWGTHAAMVVNLYIWTQREGA